MKILACVIFLLAFSVFATEIENIHLVPSPNMVRTNLYYMTPIANPQAVLVLAPGVNGSGENLVRSPVWQEFAQRNHLGLVGLSFASPEKAIHDGTGVA